MSTLGDVISWRRTEGDPVRVGDTVVTPEAWALMVRWPAGGGVWNRPVAVRVERDGHTVRYPIIDVTRLAQWTFFGLTILLIVLGLRASAPHSSQ